MTTTKPVSSSVMTSSRRHFLKLSGALAAASALPFSVQAHDHSPSIGLQLYTLRDMMAISVPATLELVAAAGYNEVEFAGYYNHTPKQIRRLLSDNGLSAPATHIMLDDFNDGPQKVIDHALEVGHQYVVVPYLTEAQRGTTLKAYLELAEQLDRWGSTLRQAGLTLGYHNHDFEFERRDGQLPYDVLLNNTDSNNLTMEMDLYWMEKAGQDPLAYFKQHPGRFALWHVKDMDEAGEFADVGTGTIDFARIFAHAGQAGVKHRFVERDHTDDRLRTITQGAKALRALSQ
ncbi:sugar phosphate isomerase/epimerase family protein [Alteromonas halophila]|uniref:Sugar phosphate isomerase n=1 Tax=Alteromonas halophila TaxID=516698 RepID=A0A918MY67_9ALTE|nr:sugar phosphate isomerase/epimerase [Alteromonas halophila]GGW83788.1 sugar phosphate isomerase [Alteromonas halophila]